MPRGSRRAAREAAALQARKRAESDALLRPPGVDRAVDGFVVRALSAAAPGRAYRCPGCDQEFDRGVPHVVVWPEGREDDRRHWHTACWDARGRRGVKVYRAKNAPRHG